MSKPCCLLTVCFNLLAHLSFSVPADSLSVDLTFEGSQAAVKADYYFYQGDDSRTDTMLFVLNPAFELIEISSEDLTEYTLTKKRGRPFPFYRLKFARPIHPNSFRKVSFRYRIDLLKTNYLKYDWIEMMVDQFWYPNARDANNRFTSSLRIKNLFPEFGLFSYQNFIKTGEGAFLVTSAKPEAEITFLAGKSMILRKMKGANAEIDFFLNQATPDSVIQSIHRKFDSTIGFYNRTFGQGRSVERFAVALRLVPRKIIGGQTTRNYLVITGSEFDSYGNYAHELAHFWWNGADFLKEPWLNESFANYSTYLAMEALDPNNLERFVSSLKTRAQQPGAVRSAGVFDQDGYALYYFKGAYLLTLLEERIGRERMLELLRLRVRENLNTTDSFLKGLERIAGAPEALYFQSQLMK